MDNSRKCGHWIPENPRPKSFLFLCSECGNTAYAMPFTRAKEHKKECAYKYCPYCGIEMEDNKDE
ncbi:MAG: hypothetical protein IJ583_12220 [Firmicutes bacterium]|nr:hypothetical protein [Bacillota bacterium]